MTHGAIYPQFHFESNGDLKKYLIPVGIIEVACAVSLYFMDRPIRVASKIETYITEHVITMQKLQVEKQKEELADAQIEGVNEFRTKKTNVQTLTKKKEAKTLEIDKRITEKGVLGLLKYQTKNLSTNFSSTILSEQGISSETDRIFRQLHILKKDAEPGSQRRTQSIIGYNGTVNESGFGNFHPGTLGELIKEGGKFTDYSNISLHKQHVEITKGGKIAESSTGEREQDEIRAVVLDHIGGIKYLYNKALKKRPGLKGKITVTFTIAASGKVIKVKIVNSTINDPELEKEIIRKIKLWIFRIIDKGEVTVIYPFIFSPGL